MKQKLIILISFILLSGVTFGQSIRDTIFNDVIIKKSNSKLNVSVVPTEILTQNGFDENTSLTFYKRKKKVVRIEYSQYFTNDNYTYISVSLVNEQPVLYETQYTYRVGFPDEYNRNEIIWNSMTVHYKVYLLNMKNEKYYFMDFDNNTQKFESVEIDKYKQDIIQSNIKQVNYFLKFKNKSINNL